MHLFKEYNAMRTLIGSDVSCVDVGRYVVNVKLDSLDSISAELRISYGFGDNSFVYDVQSQSGPFEVHRAAGRKVIDIDVSPNVFCMFLHDGGRLEFHTEESRKECCVFNFRDGDFVVF